MKMLWSTTHLSFQQQSSGRHVNAPKPWMPSLVKLSHDHAPWPTWDCRRLRDPSESYLDERSPDF